MSKYLQYFRYITENSSDFLYDSQLVYSLFSITLNDYSDIIWKVQRLETCLIFWFVKDFEFYYSSSGCIRMSNVPTLLEVICHSSQSYWRKLSPSNCSTRWILMDSTTQHTLRTGSLTKKRNHITHVLCRLHWIPVDVRINFKVLLVVYKALHGPARQYIRELLNKYQPTSQLRSFSHIMLEIPKTRTVR